MSHNGRILGGILERNALIVANYVQEKSNGVITEKGPPYITQKKAS